MKLKSTALPDNILRAMDKKDRAGVLTYEEALLKEQVRTEADLHRVCGQYLRLHGVRVIIHSRTDLKSTFDTPGVPDFLFVFNGKPSAIEFKTKEGRLSKAQVEKREEMILDGWQCAVCRSMEEVVGVLRRWKERDVKGEKE